MCCRDQSGCQVYVCILLWSLLINPSGCQVAQRCRDDFSSSRHEKLQHRELAPGSSVQEDSWTGVALTSARCNVLFDDAELQYTKTRVSTVRNVLRICSVSQICITRLGNRVHPAGVIYYDMVYSALCLVRLLSSRVFEPSCNTSMCTFCKVLKLVLLRDSSYGHVVTGIVTMLFANKKLC